MQLKTRPLQRQQRRPRPRFPSPCSAGLRRAELEPHSAPRGLLPSALTQSPPGTCSEGPLPAPRRSGTTVPALNPGSAPAPAGLLLRKAHLPRPPRPPARPDQPTGTGAEPPTTPVHGARGAACPAGAAQGSLPCLSGGWFATLHSGTRSVSRCTFVVGRGVQEGESTLQRHRNERTIHSTPPNYL